MQLKIGLGERQLATASAGGAEILGGLDLGLAGDGIDPRIRILESSL